MLKIFNKSLLLQISCKFNCVTIKNSRIFTSTQSRCVQSLYMWNMYFCIDMDLCHFCATLPKYITMLMYKMPCKKEQAKLLFLFPNRTYSYMITVIASRQFLPWALVILASAHGRRPAQSHGCGITPSRQLQHKVIWENSAGNRLLTTYQPHLYLTCWDLIFLWHPWSLTTESSAVQKAIKSHCSGIYTLLNS